ncbi:MAG: hypothetical protein HXS48_26295 [Theionarchaea archaeon]|nr:hypothetical protein [Theionarchaea archaeon]
MKSTLKTYLVFTTITLLVVIPLELIFSPHHRRTIAEYGLGYFIRHSLVGMVILFAVVSLIGMVILLKKEYTPVRMGVLSLILGFAIEFLFMRPDWVQAVVTFKIGGGTIVAVLISAFYWFAVWGIPSYVIYRYFAQELP